MLFHAPLISFVTAIVMASGITASATSVRRDDICPSGSGNPTCCDSTDDVSLISSDLETFISNTAGDVWDQSLPLGVNCLATSESQEWYCIPKFRILLDG